MKVLLALIATALWVQLLRPLFIPVSAQTEEETVGIPVAMTASGGMVYVVTEDGMLYAHSAKTSKKVAEERVGGK
jgi:hypothetical protein